MIRQTEKYDRKIVFLIGGMIGVAVFLVVYGIKILNPVYDGWLFHGWNQTDLIQHYMGWKAFRKSVWHFPIGMMDGILYPDQLSVVYTDSIPLLAVLFKLLSPILPATFQYFGIFGIASFFLSGGFSSILIYSRTDNRYYSILSSALFSTSMVLLIRMYWHTALGAQWIVLAALYLWQRQIKSPFSTGKAALSWSLLSCISISVQAYFLPMVWGIMLCSAVQRLIADADKKKTLIRLLVVVLSMAIPTVLLGWILGYFSETVSNAGDGLGAFSFNYNAFINPFGYTHILPTRNNIGWGQYEGYSYLGIGVVSVTILNFLFLMFRIIRDAYVNKRKNTNSRIKRDDLILWAKRLIPYFLFFTCFTLAAAGPQISYGRHVIPFNLPKWITDLWSVFRSTGRLIWPVYYLLLLLFVVWTYNLYKDRLKQAGVYGMIFLVICLQLAEQYPYVRSLRGHYRTDFTYQTSLTDPRWRQIANKYAHFMLYPDTFTLYVDYSIQCKGQELLIFAQDHNMTVNINYIARNASAKVNADVYEWFSSDSIRTDNSTVYVFLDKAPPEDSNLKIYVIDGITIGLREDLV